VRREVVQRLLGITDHSSLYAAGNEGRIREYYTNLLNGNYNEYRLRPGNRNYRFLTRSIVIKQNQGLLDRINWFRDEFGVKAIHLVRHPIAVALSREQLPLLLGFQNCELREQFTADQLWQADRIIREGDHLECGVLAWCLHHAPALRDHVDETLLISYEHTLLQSEIVLQNILNFLDISSEPKEIIKYLNRPSGVMRKSDVETRRMHAENCSASILASKWRSKVDQDEEARLLELLELFEVPIYQAGQDLPMAWRGHSFDGD
jgi:hypothetical protein